MILALLESCENHVLKNKMYCSYASSALGFHMRPDAFNWERQISPFFWSAMNNNIDVLKYLLTFVDLKKFYQLEMICPIEFLCRQSLSEQLHCLFEAGFFFHVEVNDFIRAQCPLECPILFIFEYGNANILNSLIKFGALELVFGQDNWFNSLRLFLLLIWVHSMGEDYDCFMDKFSTFLRHSGTGIFEIMLRVDDDNQFILKPLIPSLQQFC